MRPLAARSALIVVALSIACSNKPPDDQDYVAKLAAERAAKDAAFQKDDDPVPDNRKAEFLPLAYFPIDPGYKVGAALKLTEGDIVISMSTSTGTQRQMRKVGTLEFSLRGQLYTLTAFVEVGAPNLNRLFVPFGDLTSGTETYPAGRYIDLDRTATGIYELDFNRAYNPYCYYNASYECPFPPAENRLKTPIRSGERLKPPST